MIFRFKQFELNQSDCAMKVGTDGVLLGAWCSPSNGKALDIGTGTGLIALMIAQRNPSLKIDAIEIDESAQQQAASNFNASKWKDNLYCHFGNFITTEFDTKYDLIVCNPPYFVNSTKAGSVERTTARHSDSLGFEELIEKVLGLLGSAGKFSIILPKTEGDLLKSLAIKKGLFLNRVCSVYPKPNAKIKRLLMEFSIEESSIVEESLVIEAEERHNYTKEYITLTKDFYLNM